MSLHGVAVRVCAMMMMVMQSDVERFGQDAAKSSSSERCFSG